MKEQSDPTLPNKVSHVDDVIDFIENRHATKYKIEKVNTRFCKVNIMFKPGSALGGYTFKMDNKSIKILTEYVSTYLTDIEKV